MIRTEKDYPIMESHISDNERDQEQHSLLKSVILHLLPGILILLFFIILTPVLTEKGFPTLFCLFLAVILILIPFEFGYILYQAKKRNKTLSLEGIVLYRQKISLWQYFVIIPLFIAWAFISYFFISPPIQDHLRVEYFLWLPDWFFLSYNIENASKSALLATWFLGVLFNGIAGPIVEELYFRGYLLPRISRFKGWAPLLNVFLFSVYHFFSPWRNLERILAMLPGAYIIQWKKNIYLGIIPHCILNTTGMLLMAPLVFS
jgi:membrane protease YdiL (CAAX protease family)